MTAARIRQAVIAARDLDGVVSRLRSELSLGEPFNDPAVSAFGLRNAVFALGDTFLEVVSPERPDSSASAGRLLDRRGEDCGYMVMFQVGDLQAPRERARAAGVREVFEISLDDIDEVHLHPRDIEGAIVSLSVPVPAQSWRWGGPDWGARAAELSVAGVTVAVPEPSVVGERWRQVIGSLPGVEFVADTGSAGIVEIALAANCGGAERPSIQLGAVRLTFSQR